MKNLLIPGKDNYPLWDSHVHIFPEKMMKAVSDFFRSRYGWTISFPTNPESLALNLANQGVEKAFILAYTHKSGLARELNRWLADFVHQHPQFEAFGAVHPDEPDLEEVVQECLDDYQFAGLKIHCLVQKCRPDDPKLYPLYDAAAKRSRGVIIHASNFPLPYRDYLGIKGITRVLEQFPELNLIVPHLGLYDLRGYSTLFDRYRNLFLDTSFVFQNQAFVPPIEEIHDVMLAYPDRFIYGSDYPFISDPLLKGIERIMELNLPKDSLDQLFYKNAARFLKTTKTS